MSHIQIGSGLGRQPQRIECSGFFIPGGKPYNREVYTHGFEGESVMIQEVQEWRCPSCGAEGTCIHSSELTNRPTK